MIDKSVEEYYLGLLKERDEARRDSRAYIKESGPGAIQRAERRSSSHLALLQYLESLDEAQLEALMDLRFSKENGDSITRSQKISKLLLRLS